MSAVSVSAVSVSAVRVSVSVVRCGMQVDMAIQDGAGKTKVETQDFRLKPQKTMFGYDSTEKVEGWVCRIFEANGRMTAMEHLKVSHCLRQSVSRSVSQSMSQSDSQGLDSLRGLLGHMTTMHSHWGHLGHMTTWSHWGLARSCDYNAQSLGPARSYDYNTQIFIEYAFCILKVAVTMSVA